MNEPRMTLTNLKQFHHSMLDNGKKSAHIPFKYGKNKVALDIHFFAGKVPFALGIGKKGADPIYFEIEVEKGYRVNIKLDENYGLLCEALGFDPDEGTHGFKTGPFFKALNESIPAKYHATNNKLRPQDRAAFDRDVEECDKIYFMGWQHNGEHGIRKPTRRNLEKTLKYLGEAAYERAKPDNLSSRWTDVEEWAIDVSYGDDI